MAQEFHCGANCEYAEHARGKVQRIECVAFGIARSDNPTLDVSVLVTGLWGCIESVILKKCAVEYWDNGIAYTDRFINLWMQGIFREES